jgi:chromate transporter
VLAVGLAAWWIPLLIVTSFDFGTTVFRDEAFFFAKAAVVTFGGAYAVLAYINQAAVLKYGWVTQSQMVAGLGLAESTPGPLIMVTEFVGFLGAYQLHGSLSPTAAGTLGAVVTVWATFAPCFLWIFLGAPYIERLRGNVRISAALAGITAAVVGTIASVAVTFAVNTLFSVVHVRDVAWTVVAVPVLSSVKLPALAVAVVAFVGMHRFKWHVVPVVLGAAAAGLIWSVLT